MNNGPQRLLQDLKYEAKRAYLQSQFPEWFNNNLTQFNVFGFIEWANQHSLAERNDWLRELDVHEVAKVIEQYRLWSTMTHFAQMHSPDTIHDWLTRVLPFWFNNDQFDHLGFAAWYGYANFMDKEIAFKYLKPTEQKAVLKARSAQPLITLTHLYTLERNKEPRLAEPEPPQRFRVALD